jgi:hypothetical protein
MQAAEGIWDLGIGIEGALGGGIFFTDAQHPNPNSYQPLTLSSRFV